MLGSCVHHRRPSPGTVDHVEAHACQGQAYDFVATAVTNSPGMRYFVPYLYAEIDAKYSA